MILVPAKESRAVCSRGEAIRALSDNRERYLAQSANTRDGQRGELPPPKNWTDDMPTQERAA